MILGTHFRGRDLILAYIRRGSIFRGHLEALSERVPFLLMFGGKQGKVYGALGGSKQVILRWSGNGHFGGCL